MDATCETQAFDNYAAGFGWEYDNGGRYAGLDWDWYASSAHRWERLPDETVRQTLVIMRREQSIVVAVHFAGRQSTELWSGEIRTTADFHRLLTIIADYMAGHDVGS